MAEKLVTCPSCIPGERVVGCGDTGRRTLWDTSKRCTSRPWSRTVFGGAEKQEIPAMVPGISLGSLVEGRAAHGARELGRSTSKDVKIGPRQEAASFIKHRPRRPQRCLLYHLCVSPPRHLNILRVRLSPEHER